VDIVENFGKNVNYVVVALTAEVKQKRVVNLSAYILFTAVACDLLLQKIKNHINNEP
jgi:hypothetical protein